jgi:hypothetical protein
VADTRQPGERASLQHLNKPPFERSIEINEADLPACNKPGSDRHA